MTDLSPFLLEGAFIAALGLAFYLVLIRPQLQRLQRHRAMLASLSPGDRIATVGGLVGTVVRLDGDTLLIVEVADGVQMTITRKSVDALLDPSVVRASARMAREPAIVSLH